jgi:hypothetical protein
VNNSVNKFSLRVGDIEARRIMNVPMEIVQWAEQTCYTIVRFSLTSDGAWEATFVGERVFENSVNWILLGRIMKQAYDFLALERETVWGEKEENG